MKFKGWQSFSSSFMLPRSMLNGRKFACCCLLVFTKTRNEGILQKVVWVELLGQRTLRQQKSKFKYVSPFTEPRSVDTLEFSGRFDYQTFPVCLHSVMDRQDLFVVSISTLYCSNFSFACRSWSESKPNAKARRKWSKNWSSILLEETKIIGESKRKTRKGFDRLFVNPMSQQIPSI